MTRTSTVMRTRRDRTMAPSLVSLLSLVLVCVATVAPAQDRRGNPDVVLAGARIIVLPFRNLSSSSPPPPAISCAARRGRVEWREERGASAAVIIVCHRQLQQMVNRDRKPYPVTVEDSSQLSNVGL